MAVVHVTDDEIIIHHNIYVHFLRKIDTSTSYSPPEHPYPTFQLQRKKNKNYISANPSNI